MFSENAIECARSWAEKCYPEECCGIISNGEFVKCDNIIELLDCFSDGCQVSCNKSNRCRLKDFEINHNINLMFDIQAVIHSHTNGRNFPSSSDMSGQMAMGIPWGICSVYEENNKPKASDVHFWGDQIPKVPLVGRQFRHGPTGTDGRGDCYALMRDAYLEMFGIRLPEFPRDDDWWNDGENLYEDGFRQAGFEVIGTGQHPSQSPIPGDAVLMKWVRRSPGPHHAAMITENGLVLHHRAGHLSGHEPLLPWIKHITHWLRYVGT